MTWLIIWLSVSSLFFALVGCSPPHAITFVNNRVEPTKRIRTSSSSATANNEERGRGEVVAKAASTVKQESSIYHQLIETLPESNENLDITTLATHVTSFNKEHPQTTITLFKAAQNYYEKRRLPLLLTQALVRNEREKIVIEKLRNEQLLYWLNKNTSVKKVIRILNMKELTLSNLLNEPSTIMLVDYIHLLNQKTGTHQTLLDYVPFNEKTLLQRLSVVLEKFNYMYLSTNSKNVINVMLFELYDSWRLEKLTAYDVFKKLKFGESFAAILFQRTYQSILVGYALPQEQSTFLLSLLIQHFGEAYVAENLMRWKYITTHFSDFSLREQQYAAQFTRYEAEKASQRAGTLLWHQLENWEKSKRSIVLVVKLLTENSNEVSVFNKYKLKVIWAYINRISPNKENDLLHALMEALTEEGFAKKLQLASRDSTADAIAVRMLQKDLFGYWMQQNITPSNIRAMKFENANDVTTDEIVDLFTRFYDGNAARKRKRDE